ncbi:MAG: endonuclease/exonuclease/phosphatase family protein [Prosthecobacter sp.]|nr:endonuclease/exonuclease/phosphatase family protein [Prosthecobacter sp.]
MRYLLRMVPKAGWICLTVGVLLQAFAKDRYPGLALFFYALPKPCLAVLSVTLLVWPGMRRKSRLFAAVTALAITGWWVSASWVHRQDQATVPQVDGRELKVLFWNLCRPRGLDLEMVELVRRFQPDVAAFVEPGPQAGPLAAEYEKLLPGYRVEFMPRGVLWVTRVPSRFQGRGKLEGAGAFARFEVTGLGPPFPFVVADVYPHVLHSREPQLQEALAHAQDRDDAILMGDFNTPAESVFFDSYRSRYVDAFETAGYGFRETWPLGLPLLSLDHIWVGKDWAVIAAQKLNLLSGSDHAALLVTLRRR